MRFVIAGGGTGGHIYPAVAVAERLQTRGEVCLLARSGSREERIFQEHGLTVRTVQSSPLLFSPAALWRFVRTVVTGTADACRTMRSYRPDAFIGTGGYVSVPGVLAAERCHVPVFLLEQNSVMGRANRLFSRHARRVFLGFPLENGNKGKRFLLTGNPLRRAVYQSLVEIRERSPARKGLLFIGGSGGARFINELLPKVAERLERDGRDLDIYAVTGEDEYTETRRAVERLALQHVHAHVVPYEEHMERLYAQTSVAVSRGGASTLTEIAVGGIYALIIPYPYAMGHHQSKNALYLEQLGLGKCFEQQGFDSEGFYAALYEALDTPSRTNSILPFPFDSDAAERIAATIEEEIHHV